MGEKDEKEEKGEEENYEDALADKSYYQAETFTVPNMDPRKEEGSSDDSSEDLEEE